jgi:transcriptional regulator with XRE-family HTH domain
VDVQEGEHMEEKAFHHGIIIREYRQRKGYTQEELACRWHSDTSGVGYKYVLEVEHGSKSIAKQSTLRRVATLLDIPLWKLGLSDSTKVIQAMKDAGYGQETEVAELENELREIVMNDPHMKNALD